MLTEKDRQAAIEAASKEEEKKASAAQQAAIEAQRVVADPNADDEAKRAAVNKVDAAKEDVNQAAHVLAKAKTGTLFLTPLFVRCSPRRSQRRST